MKALPLENLISPNFMLKRIRVVHRSIDQHLRELPEHSFRPYFFRTAAGPKQLAQIDFMAETTFISAVAARFGSAKVRLLGEESLSESICLERENRTCVLVDMIDGTDLLERGFANWCSAIVVFAPRKREILASFVATPALPPTHQGILYYATKDGAFKVPLKAGKVARPTRLQCVRTDKTLRDASVCMYAQKSNNFQSLVGLNRKRKLVSWLEQNRKINSSRKTQVEGELQFRFYNLAGNPMMVRLVDGSVDVVFDLNGQSPHDVVPGAYIALKAGAVLGSLEGKIMSEHHLAKALLRPGSTPIKYILAGNQPMYKELAGLLA